MITAGVISIIVVCGLVIAGIMVVFGLVNGDIDFDDIPFGKNKDQKEWKMFNKYNRPRSSGWYLCTVENGSRFPMLLYYDMTKEKFLDPVRQSVFNTYEVMVTKKFEEGAKTDSIMPDDTYMERIFTDEACDRTEYVIAWKPEPKVFMGEVKNNRNVGKDRANPVNIDAGHSNHGHSNPNIDDIVDKFNALSRDYILSADEIKAAMRRATEYTTYTTSD